MRDSKKNDTETEEPEILLGPGDVGERASLAVAATLGWWRFVGSNPTSPTIHPCYNKPADAFLKLVAA